MLAKYTRMREPLADVNTGTSPQPVDIAKLNLRLLFGEERRDGFDTIRIAQLVRSPSGAVVLKTELHPHPSFAWRPRRTSHNFRSLLTAMTARQRALAESRRQRSAGQVEFDAGDLPKLWLLSTLNTYIPRHRARRRLARDGAEQVDLILGQLIGALSTMAVDADHHDPEVHVPTSAPRSGAHVRCRGAHRFRHPGPLARDPADAAARRRVHRSGVGPDIMRSDFFLAVTTALPDQQVRERLPRLMKIASTNQIGAIMHSAVTGTPVELEYRPPSAPCSSPASTGSASVARRSSGPTSSRPGRLRSIIRSIRNR